MGRPSKYKTPAQLQKAIDDYFTNCPDKVMVSEGVKTNIFTISGLAYHLGFESRQSFYDYENRKGFSYTIKRARLRIEVEYEKQLHFGQCTGAIFALKNFDWSDKREIEHSGSVEMIEKQVQNELEKLKTDDLIKIAHEISEPKKNKIKKKNV